MRDGNDASVAYPELLGKLITSTAEALNTDTVDHTVPLSEIGIDSLNIVEIIIACEEIYGDFAIDASELQFDEMTTLADMHNQMISFEVLV